MTYYSKYLKYKNKYLSLKNYVMIGGTKEYDEIINIYNEEKGKHDDDESIIKAKEKVIEHLKNILDEIKKENEPNKSTLKKNFLNLRILMDNKFMKDINCKYAYLNTPKKYGCDLLELIYNILSNDSKKEIELRNTILSDLVSCSLEKSSIPHIMTDIDDTIYPNPGILNINIAGSDYSWEKKKLYPGIEKFYECYTKFTQKNHDGIIIYNTILSATPTALKNHKFTDIRLKKALSDNFSFLSGKDSKIKSIKDIEKKIDDEGEFSLEPNAESVGATKFEKFVKYKALFPEYKLLFIGDNGQGDLIAGEKMLIVDENCMVFIHNIIKKNNNFKFDDITIKKYIDKDKNKGRLFFFKNYYELSQIFLNLNLLDQVSVNSIKQSVSEELIKDKYSKTDAVSKNYYCCNKELCMPGCIEKK